MAEIKHKNLIIDITAAYISEPNDICLVGEKFWFLQAKLLTKPNKEPPREDNETSLPSTQEGLLRVVPATFPGKQEHLTV